MKPYKILTMIRVFGNEFKYTDLPSCIMLADKHGTFTMKVMKPEKTSKKLRLHTVLDDLRWQKCTLEEGSEIVEVHSNYLLKEQAVECEPTGIVLPHATGDLNVLRTADNRILFVHKEAFDSFNWYELYAGEHMLVGHARGGNFSLKLFKEALDTKTMESITLLREMR